MKKFNDWAAKNLYNIIKKLWITKYKVIHLIIDRNIIKKYQKNEKITNIKEKPENKSKIEKKLID